MNDKLQRIWKEPVIIEALSQYLPCRIGKNPRQASVTIACVPAYTGNQHVPNFGAETLLSHRLATFVIPRPPKIIHNFTPSPPPLSVIAGPHLTVGRPQWPAARSNSSTVFAGSNTGVMPLQAWMSVCVCSVSAVLPRADPPSKESYRLFIGFLFFGATAPIWALAYLHEPLRFTSVF
jgi:hypothetical protein